MKHPNKPDNPGMLIPPIIFYILAFIVAILIQQILPIDNSFFRHLIVKIAGTLLIAATISGILLAFENGDKIIASKIAVLLSSCTAGLFGYLYLKILSKK